jgi:putative restriction endonuclease
MLINQKEYHEVDTVEKITIADSFVVKSNKLGDGNGEAKLYIGNDSSALRSFYGQSGFSIRCFLLKSDLIKFLSDLESEYKNPQLPYQNRDELPTLFNDRMIKIGSLPDIIFYSISHQNHLNPPRVYVNSTDINYQLLRELPLPDLSYLSIRKLQANDGEIIFYTRLFSDYRDSFGQTAHPAQMLKEEQVVSEDTSLTSEEKLQTVKARIGQGKYRKRLLEECPFCPFTMVSDDRLLIASHIKPWSVSNLHEKTDSKNGFMFTPTIDYLFDQGFITFEHDKKLLVSPWLSTSTINRLQLKPESIVTMLPIEGRQDYLDYHREIIFKS